MKIMGKSVLAFFACAMIVLAMFLLTACGSESAKYTVTFKYNYTNHWDVSESSKTVVSGEKTTAPTILRSDYRFGGWFTDNTTFQNQFDFATTPITSNLTVYAKWTENKAMFLEQLDANATANPVTYNQVTYTDKIAKTQNQTAIITNNQITIDSNMINVRMTSAIFTSLYNTNCEITSEYYDFSSNGSLFCRIAFIKDNEKYIQTMKINNKSYVEEIVCLVENEDEQDTCLYSLSNCQYSI